MNEYWLRGVPSVGDFHCQDSTLPRVGCKTYPLHEMHDDLMEKSDTSSSAHRSQVVSKGEGGDPSLGSDRRISPDVKFQWGDCVFS